MEQGYPVTLVHPHYKPAKIVTGHAAGGEKAQPERFSPVTVNGSNDEAYFRAQGYLRPGEAQPTIDHHEYPKFMRHPEHKDAISAQTEARIENNRIAGTFQIPGVPEIYPDAIAKDKKEEDSWREKGYIPAGEYKREVLESILDGTINKEVYVPDQYPMWTHGEDGPTLIETDPDAPDLDPSPEYPRWENGVIIEDPRFPKVDPHKYPMWVHKDGIPSEESQPANNPQEEFEIRRKWALKEEPKPEPTQDINQPELPSLLPPVTPKPRTKASTASA